MSDKTYNITFRFFIFIVFALLFSFSGCKDRNEDDITPSSITNYPLDIGTEWIYNRQLVISIYNDQQRDTITNTTRIWIEKDTTLFDTIDVKVFNIKASEQITNIAKQYINIDDEGLKRYAYTKGGVLLKSYTIKLPTLFLNTTSSKFDINQIIVEEPPVLIEKLPLNLSSSWTYKDTIDSSLFGIKKHVVGSDIIITQANSYMCYKVKWEHLNTDIFRNTSIVEWIANEGIIKHEAIHDSITVEDEIGIPIYPAKIIDTYTLKGFIQP